MACSRGRGDGLVSRDAGASDERTRRRQWSDTGTQLQYDRSTGVIRLRGGRRVGDQRDVVDGYCGDSKAGPALVNCSKGGTGATAAHLMAEESYQM